jgi:recombination protein RecA
MSDEAELKKMKVDLKTLEKRQSKLEGKEDDSKKEEEDEKLKGDYGAKKAKLLSGFFRTTNRDLKRTNCILLIISQIRDDLKAKYGTKALRTGGKGMDFYATMVIWLDEEKIIQSATYKIPQGATIGAYVRKNKVYSPRRRAKFDLLYTHGVENFGSLVDFCALNGGIKKYGGHYEWNDKKYFKNDLIKYFDKHKNEYEDLLELSQDTWNKMEEDAKINLSPKWRLTEPD